MIKEKEKQHEKLNLLFHAPELAGPFVRNASRGGVYFVALNLLRELKRQDRFNITLYYGKQSFITMNKIRRDDFLSGFHHITLLDYEETAEAVKKHKSVLKKEEGFDRCVTLVKFIKNCFDLARCKLLNFNAAKLKRINIVLTVKTGFLREIYKYVYTRFVILHDSMEVQGYIDFMNMNEAATGGGGYNGDGKKIFDNLNTSVYYFCVSNNTKKDYLDCVPEKIDPNKMFITPIAASNKFSPLYDIETRNKVLSKFRMFNNTDMYILSLCSLFPHKNLVFTVKNFIDFIEKHGILNLYFVMAGGGSNVNIDETRKLFSVQIEKFKKYRDKIILTGYVDDADVNILYSNALFFTYISKYEGFGMPPLEAMQAGTPVITSNNSSLPEVAGGAAIMIDCESDEQCIAAFESLYFNESLRGEYIAKGLERAKQFSWEKTVDTMTGIILDISRKEGAG